ncbi:alpha-ribazole phosphatase [Acetivibrio clariflavus]|uniref:Alpha-ribazole phosphatase n=1 Tax=Acetivibrio clariflavus (strain DSM 19732 / NBRC 101661 / EBR45) TaxID=720554 RepID=G8LSS7_ACECE|nr:alpha-ribazole phosphatase [Acetivibrio clariflavus]AEV69429.1 alpha-ribazole phosphatase [Acetivibrio clariflavus DSM 19732]
MLELILIRHGETDSNIRGSYLGWTDMELNENGIDQVKLLKERLKGVKVDKIYSSPLKRALQTAKIINENYNLDIVTDDGLKERNFGIWDDLTHEEMARRYPEEYNEWINDWIKYRIKDGESAQEAYDRAAVFVDEVIKSNKDGVVMLVTHLGTIRFILAYLLGLGIENSWRFRVNNASITKVEINDGYSVLTMLNG